MKPDTKRLIEATEDWQPCRPGAFSEPCISFKKRIARRKPYLVSLGLIYFCGVMIFATVILSWTSQPKRGQMAAPRVFSCEQVRPHLADYSAMNVHECGLRASISKHLAQCSDCDLIYQELAGNIVFLGSGKTQCDYPQAPVCDAQK